MKTLMLSKLKLFFLSLLAILSMSFANSIYAAIVTVNCNGDSNARADIQAALDNANSGDIINLIGTCQLDGTQLIVSKSNITIQGAGAAGNWSTVISGLTDSNGLPLGDNLSSPYNYFNRGLSIGPTSNNISNVTIRGIKFQGFNRGIEISPSVSATNIFCSGITVTSGNASNITVANNWFDNSSLPVESYGLENHINVINNLVTNSGRGPYNIDIFIAGQFALCYRQNLHIGVIPVGLPDAVNISSNVINNDDATVPIELIAASAKIASNTITAGPNAGYATIDDAANTSFVQGNIIDGNGFSPVGIMIDYAFMPYSKPTNFLVVNNELKNFAPSIGAGITVNSSVSGASMSNNYFNNAPGADYLLCDANGDTNATAHNNCYPNGGLASFNNTVVVTNPNTTVMNLGNNNKIVGNTQ